VSPSVDRPFSRLGSVLTHGDSPPCLPPSCWSSEGGHRSSQRSSRSPLVLGRPPASRSPLEFGRELKILISERRSCGRIPSARLLATPSCLYDARFSRSAPVRFLWNRFLPNALRRAFGHAVSSDFSLLLFSRLLISQTPVARGLSSEWFRSGGRLTGARSSASATGDQASFSFSYSHPSDSSSFGPSLQLIGIVELSVALWFLFLSFLGDIIESAPSDSGASFFFAPPIACLQSEFGFRQQGPLASTGPYSYAFHLWSSGSPSLSVRSGAVHSSNSEIVI